jgi:hypothetical protein
MYVVVHIETAVHLCVCRKQKITSSLCLYSDILILRNKPYKRASQNFVLNVVNSAAHKQELFSLPCLV